MMLFFDAEGVAEKSEYAARVVTGAAVRLLVLRGATVHFANDFGKNVVDVCPLFCRGFDEGTAPKLRQCGPLVLRDFALMLQINLEIEKR